MSKKNGHDPELVITGAPGRVYMYEDPLEFIEKVDEYFEYAKNPPPGEDGILATITGLMLYLGFKSRQSFYEYRKRSEKWEDAIDYAKLKLENLYEERLNTNRNPVPAVFALKQLGWKDTQQIESTEESKIKVEYEPVEGLPAPSTSETD